MNEFDKTIAREAVLYMCEVFDDFNVPNDELRIELEIEKLRADTRIQRLAHGIMGVTSARGLVRRAYYDGKTRQ